MAADASEGWRSSPILQSGIIPDCRRRRSVGCWYVILPASASPRPFLSTDLTAKPEQILRWFVTRWRMETTFQEARSHLGVETQRQWSDLAILRTTPALLGLSAKWLIEHQMPGTLRQTCKLIRYDDHPRSHTDQVLADHERPDPNRGGEDLRLQPPALPTDGVPSGAHAEAAKTA